MTTWQQLCDDQELEGIPCRVELSRHGQLILRPHRSYHSIFQSRIVRSLNKLLPHGEAMPECPIETEVGTVVADVAWASPEKVKKNFDLPSWAESPEIVIEVLSPSNARDEINNKRKAVFAKGALEFWLCGENGEMRFFVPTDEIKSSKLCPEFRTKSIKLKLLLSAPAPPTYCVP